MLSDAPETSVVETDEECRSGGIGMVSKLKAIITNEASCEVDACVIITQQEHNEVGMCDVVMRQSFASSLEEPCRSDDEFSNDDLDGDEDDTDVGFGTYVCILNLFIAQKATCTSMLFNAQCMHTYMYF